MTTITLNEEEIAASRKALYAACEDNLAKLDGLDRDKLNDEQAEIYCFGCDAGNLNSDLFEAIVLNERKEKVARLKLDDDQLYVLNQALRYLCGKKRSYNAADELLDRLEDTISDELRAEQLKFWRNR